MRSSTGTQGGRPSVEERPKSKASKPGSLSTLPRLGVNIDHFATLRQLRGTPYPDLLEAVSLAVVAGAQQITLHLREDRRHIQDDDVRVVQSFLRNKDIDLNLEMAVTPAMLRFAVKTAPEWACLVPERRAEQTTEGGLDVKTGFKKVRAAIKSLHKVGIKVSPFIEPDVESVWLCRELGADAVELHTGEYGRHYQALQRQVDDKPSVRLGKYLRKGEAAKLAMKVDFELERIRRAAEEAHKAGLRVHAGHGLDEQNVRPLAGLMRAHPSALRPQKSARKGTLFANHTASVVPLIQEYNIGHYLVCRASIVGLERAVREMMSALQAP